MCRVDKCKLANIGQPKNTQKDPSSRKSKKKPFRAARVVGQEGQCGSTPLRALLSLAGHSSWKKKSWAGWEKPPPPNRWKRQIMHKNKMGRLFKVFLADCWVRKPTVKHVRNILSSFVGKTTFCVWLDGKSTGTDGFLSCNNVPTAAPRAWVPFP